MSEANIDFETRSDVDIRGLKTGPKGSGRYFESPHFDVLLMAYSIAGGPVKCWRRGQPCPLEIRAHFEAGGTCRAFNASFERRCLRWLSQHHGWPVVPIENFRCTAAEAAAMALPRSLDSVAEALGTPATKDKRGAALIQKFSIPRNPRAGEDPTGIYFNEPEEFPAEFDEFEAYAKQDVITEQAVAKRTFPLSEYEQRVYVLDQIINDRGIRIDRVSAEAAVKLAAKALAKLDEELRQITGGFVRKVSDVARLVEWVKAQGITLDSAAKADLIELLEADDLPKHVRRAVEIRQEGGKSSVSKFQAMLDYASTHDDRMRHLFVYHAASTGRWQSRGFNNYNLPRPRKVFDDAHLNTEHLFDAIRSGSPDLLEWSYGRPLGDPLHLLSDAIRGFEWAAPGHEYVQADYSGIEGAVIAWSSGEDWKVKAMFEIMADPSLPDMYVRTAAGIVGVDVREVMKGGKLYHLRQMLGKVAELSLGFAGGVAAFVSMAKNYGVDLNALYDPVWASAGEKMRERAENRYLSCLKRKAYKTDVMTREAWLACEIVKTGWREQNAAISAGWKTREAAIRDAIKNPGVIYDALKMRYVVKAGYLVVQLPSSRCLFYASPKLKDQVQIQVLCDDGSWEDAEPIDREVAEKQASRGEVKILGASSPSITVLGVDKTGKKMQREHVHAGIFAENDTQAIARDLLVNGMFKAEAAGYPIVGTTYDEILAEMPRGVGDLPFFEKLICELPPWANGLPLQAGGWVSKRYKKA